MWALGGAAGNSDGSVTYYYSDVYASGSGSSWTKVNAAAPFGGRYGSQALSYNGKLWLIGGNSNGTLMNDVWSSTDGASWTQVLAASAGTATQFTPREDFGALVYNNAMWVIGGFSAGAGIHNDVWSSIDGVNWTQVLADGASGAAHFQGRWGLSAVVYNNLMWIIGGATGSSSGSVSFGFADVWNSANGNAWTQQNSTATYTPFGPDHYEQTVVNAANLLAVTGGMLDLDGGWSPEYEYDTSSDGINWNRALGNYMGRFYHLSLEFNGNVWVIGGCNNICTSIPCPTSPTYFNDVWYTQQ